MSVVKSWHVTLALLGTACAAPGSTSTTDASESSTHAQSSDPASGSPTDTSTTQAGSGDTTDTGVVTDATVTTDPDDGSGTGGDALVHGEPYVVAGAFLAKPMAAPLVWDDCSHGDDPLDRWTTVYPNTSTDSVAPGEEWSCREAPFTRPQGEAAIAIAHPTARGTHIAAGGLTAPVADANSGAVGANIDFDRPAAPFYTLSTWWERVDPAWNPGDYDNNFKFWDWSVGSGWYGERYWYFDYAQTELFDPENSLYRVDLAAPAYENNDDSNPAYLDPPHVWGDGGGDAREWIQRTVVAYWADDPEGRISLYEGELPNAANPITVDGQTADPYDGVARNLAIGGYNRAVGHSTNWRYFADMFQDVGEGWFYLADAESWDDASIAVLQPWQQIDETSASLVCNGGSLPSGTVYLHYRLAPWKREGHALVGTFTLE